MTVRDAAPVSAQGVSKNWGTTVALTDVTADVGTGITGLVGANGSGKTTLISLMLGLQPPTAGSLSVLGLDPVRSGPEIRARVGYSPEHHNLPEDMKAYDLVRHLAEVRGLPVGEARSRASDAMWLVGLGEERFRAVGTMSTGQRQRVKLAQAIAHDPSLVLLDEPTDGLDPVQRDAMLGLIRTVSVEAGVDVVVSSHLLEEVERICDGILVLDQGQAVLSGSMDTLRLAEPGMRVEVDEGVAALAEALAAVGLEVARDGSALIVVGGEGVDVESAVRDEVAARDLPLRSLVPRRLTLEELFLRAGTYGR